MTHPNTVGRSKPSLPDAPRVLVFTTDERKLEWIDAELAGTSITVLRALSVSELVRMAVDAPPPKPQILVVDFDAVSTAELAQLHAIRDRGWFGCVMALGKVSLALRKSLNIERVLVAPLSRFALRSAITTIGASGPTMRIARIVSG